MRCLDIGRARYEVPRFRKGRYEMPRYRKPRYEVPRYRKPGYEVPRYGNHGTGTRCLDLDMRFLDVGIDVYI